MPQGLGHRVGFDYTQVPWGAAEASLGGWVGAQTEVEAIGKAAGPARISSLFVGEAK